MSMNAIPAGLILNLARRQGVGYQTPLKLYAPKFEINEEYLTDCPVTFSHNNGGETDECGMRGYSHVDHPAFDSLRRYLGSNGYIEIGQGWNGDTVLKEFELNGVRFDVGDTFLCASAMKHHLDCLRNCGEDEGGTI